MQIYYLMKITVGTKGFVPYDQDFYPVTSETYYRQSLQGSHGPGDHPCLHLKFAWTPPIPPDIFPNREIVGPGYVFKTNPQYRYGITWYDELSLVGGGFVWREFSHPGSILSPNPYEVTSHIEFYPTGRYRNLVVGHRVFYNDDGTVDVQDNALPSMWGVENTCYVISGPEVPSHSDEEIDNVAASAMEKARGIEPLLVPYSEVFRDCVNSISAGSNNIANVLEWGELLNDLRKAKFTEIGDDIKKLTSGNIKEIKNLVSSGWLAKRYAIDTAKSDLNQIAEYTLSGIDVEHLDHFKRYSTMRNDYGITTCRVVFSTGHPINKTLRHLETTGFMLNEYTAWDMVPMSFIVDWFLPIGDFLEDWSQNWVSNSSVFNYHSIICSHKWVFEDRNLGIEVEGYHRVLLTDPPPFESYSSDPSTGTIVKRIVDAGALIIGG